MARLRPTLFIGLGSTGMRVLGYLQKMMLEEYGTFRLPVLQYLVFETNQLAEISEHRSMEFQSVSVGAAGIQTALQRMSEQQNLRDRFPREQGYFDWLNTRALQPCDDGVGGNRMLGRFVLWERWGDVREKVEAAHRICTNPESRRESIRVINDHYTRHGESAKADDELISKDFNIRVIGTLVGGSCSGMFADFGYMLRSLFPDTPERILTVTTLKARDTGNDRLYKGKANCYGALTELDFHFQRTPKDAWSYRLPDGSGVAKANEAPYSHVFVLSGSNGKTTLDEKGLNQMIAMDHFLDTVGEGRGAKGGAERDIRDELDARHRNTQGYVHFFSTYGLSAIWYPKAKITGTAACRLAEKYCLRWRGTLPQQTADTESRIDPHAEGRRFWQSFEAQVARDLGIGERPDVPLLQEVEQRIADRAQSRNVTTDFSVPLRGTFEVELSGELEGHAASIDRRARDRQQTAISGLADGVRTTLLEKFKNCAMTDSFLEGMHHAASSGAPSGKGTPNAKEIAPPPRPDLRPLERMLQDIEHAKNDPWIRALGLTRSAVKARRARYVRRFNDLWLAHLKKHLDYQRRRVIRHVLAAWPEITESAYKLSSKVDEVLRTIKRRTEEFAELGQAPDIVHLVYASEREGFEGDVEKNAQLVEFEKDGRTPRSPNPLSFDWLRLDKRLPEAITSEAAFWAQSAEIIGDQLIDSYQSEGLQLLGEPHQKVEAVAQNSASIRALAEAAHPYQQFGPLHRERRDAAQSDFIFGHRREPLAEVARIAGLRAGNERAFGATGLRHMLFLYREERGFAINALELYESVRRGEHLQKHPFHWTHQHPDFYNWRRFENVEKVELLMEVSYLLPGLRAKVFEESSPGLFRFRAVSRGMVRYFPTNEPSEYREMAATNDVPLQLEDRVVQALRTWGTFERYSTELSIPRSDDLQRELAAAIHDPTAEQDIQRRLSLLNDFNLKVAEPAFA